jgi:hypothetical protein
MKTLLVLALSLFTFTARADKAPTLTGAATLVAGTSIGPFKLGMTRAEVEKLGAPVRNPASSVLVTGPYEIGFDKQDKVSSISRRMATDADGKALRGGVVFAGKTIDPKISFDELRKRIPGCGKPEAMIGVTLAKCDNRTSVYAAGPVGIVGVRVDR